MTALMPHALLADLAGAGTTPRLTWYGTGGERVELSGRVLSNWVVKATNLLVEEADAQPEAIVGVHMPVHWRAAVWTLAAWTAGAAVSLIEDESTDEAPSHASASQPTRLNALASWAPGRTRAADAAELILGVALPGLARSWDGGPDGSALPPGAIDAASEILGYGDELGYTLSPSADDSALDGVSFGGLAAWASSSAVTPGERRLIAPRDVHELLRDCVQVWCNGGSVVLLSPEVAADTERRSRIADDEKVG